MLNEPRELLLASAYMHFSFSELAVRCVSELFAGLKGLDKARNTGLGLKDAEVGI